MSHELTQDGVKIVAICWADEAVLNTSNPSVVSMELCPQYGEMAMQPWAKVVFTNGTVRHYNLALAESVEMFDKEEAPDAE